MPIQELIESPPAYVASALMICAMITKGFGGIEKFLTEEARGAIYDWLMRPGDSLARNRWPVVFSHVLDRAFGPSHWSWPSFWRSALVSCLVLTFLTLLATAFNSDLVHMVRWNFKALVFLFLCNVVADYLSIGKARFLIRAMSGVSSVFGLLVLMLVDVLLSIALFYYAFLLLELLLHLRNPDRHTLSVVWQTLK